MTALADFVLARIVEDESAEAELGSRFHPARVLAECEAKRRIVEWHAPATGVDDDGCRCEYDDWSNENPPYPCPTLRALAAVYADHADYREEWRP